MFNHLTYNECGKKINSAIQKGGFTIISGSFMLQQGKPVNDVAYFIGEDSSKMTGVRDPALPVGYRFDYMDGTLAG